MHRKLTTTGLIAVAAGVFLAGSPAQAQYYYPAPVAPVYYAPAPVPVVSYYAPTVTYVQPRLLRPAYVSTAYYTPVVAAPVVTTTTYVAPRLVRPRVYYRSYYAW